jgi:hypothetical protein
MARRFELILLQRPCDIHESSRRAGGRWFHFWAILLAGVGINFLYRASHTSRKYLPETMGTGVALFDYDNDGRLDIFLVNSTRLSDPTPRRTIRQGM